MPKSRRVAVHCRTDKGYFCNTFFNQTVDVIDQPRWIDTQLLFLGLIGFGVLGVIGELLVYLLPCVLSQHTIQCHTQHVLVNKNRM